MKNKDLNWGVLYLWSIFYYLSLNRVKSYDMGKDGVNLDIQVKTRGFQSIVLTVYSDIFINKIPGLMCIDVVIFVSMQWSRLYMSNSE